MLHIIIPILTLLVGMVIGALGATWFIKSKMKNLLNDPKQIQNIAKSMGYNLNQKQMNMASQSMKKLQNKKKK